MDIKIAYSQSGYRQILYSLIFLIILVGCTYSNKHELNCKENSIYVFTSKRIEKKIYDSRHEKFNLGFFSEFYYGNKKYQLDNIKVRGQSALNFRRKSFHVNIDGNFFIYNQEAGDSIKLNKFILSSMPMDYTYIENKLSHYLMNEINLWELHSSFSELYLNNSHLGIYMLIEDPKEFLFKRKNANCIIRRFYDHRIDQIEINTRKETYSEEEYVSSFNSIYETLTAFKGSELYEKLVKKLNLENYFRVIAIDEILENGDFTDEIFFYSSTDFFEPIVFEILPWDYDDIFSEFPHEIGRTDNLAGNCFGKRNYPTIEDFQNETQGRLLFSIEDDLDFVILKDDYLYFKYLETLDELIQHLDRELIHTIFQKIQEELLPFYNVKEVILQSKHDDRPTDLATFLNNLKEKEKRINDRLNWLKTEIINQRKSHFKIL